MHTAFRQTIILDGNDRDLPLEVQREISDELWPQLEKGDNDTVLFDAEDKDSIKNYPALSEFTKSNGIKECHINFGW